MPKASYIQTSFNAGELSPSLEGRIDIAKYKNGLFVCENFIPTVQGPAHRRPGTRFVSEVKDSSKRTFLAPFIFNREQSYVLEFGDSYIRFYAKQGQLTSGSGPFEVLSFYNAAELATPLNEFALRFAQSADALYIAHRNHWPAKLVRFSDTNWGLATVIGGILNGRVIYPPFDSVNANPDSTVFVSGQQGGVSVISSLPIWDPLQNDEYFYVEQQKVRNVRPWEPGKVVAKGASRRYNGVTYLAIQVKGATGSVPPTHLEGEAWDALNGTEGVLWQYQDPGYGFVKLTGSMTGPIGLTPTLGQVAAHADSSIAAVTSANPVKITTWSPHGYIAGQIVFIRGIVGTTDLNDNFYQVANPTATTFTLQNSTGAAIDGSGFAPYISGGAVTDSLYLAPANVIQQMPLDVIGMDNATSLWAHSAWSHLFGHPDQVGFFGGRLVFARDNRIWASVAEDFENFASKTPGGQVTSDMAISIQLPTEDPIRWLQDGADILVGTTAGEWSVGPTNQSAGFGPDNVRALPQLTLGSRDIPAIKIGLSIIIVQASGRKLREFSFQFIYNNYTATDLTALADHLTQDAVGKSFIATAYAQEPDSIIWCVRNDGALLGFTYSKENEVTAWHRHPLGGVAAQVESITVVPSFDGTYDQLWLIINRTIGGVRKRYVEFLTPRFDIGDDIRNAAFLDCSLNGAFGSPVTSLTGLGYLAGETVDALVDGNKVSGLTVAGDGSLVLPYAGSTITIGYRAPSKLMTMSIEAGAADGVALGKTQRITNVKFRFLATLGGSYGDIESGFMQDIEMRRHQLGGYQLPYTGVWPEGLSTAPWPGQSKVAAKVAYVNDSPFPATVVAIMPQLETQDR